MPELLSPTQALLRGVRDMVPMLVGAAPFGLIFGALCASSGLSGWHGQMMSSVVFAGSSQFIALGLLAGHASALLIWLTTLVVNLRHALYGASLLPHVQHLPLRWRLGLAALLTDEAYAMAARHYQQRGTQPLSHWYFLGCGLAMYVNWQCVTLLGIVLGQSVQGLDGLGLDFAMAVTFISIVVPQLVALPEVLAVLASGALAVLTLDWPYKSGLLASIACGVVVGMVAHRAGGKA